MHLLYAKIHVFERTVLKAENSEDSLASSCEEFCIGFHATQYETGLLLELFLYMCTCRAMLHTTLYGSAAGCLIYHIYHIIYHICRSIQKTCTLWKHGLTSKNTHSQLTYFCKSNINQTFTNGGSMIWGVRITIFYRNQTSGRRIDHLFVFFGPQKLGILTARLNRSLSISTSNSMRGD